MRAAASIFRVEEWQNHLPRYRCQLCGAESRPELYDPESHVVLHCQATAKLREALYQSVYEVTRSIDMGRMDDERRLRWVLCDLDSRVENSGSVHNLMREFAFEVGRMYHSACNEEPIDEMDGYDLDLEELLAGGEERDETLRDVGKESACSFS